MTRDRKTLSAVFMAVLMVLASGTAVSLAVTGSTGDAGANAVGVQETTTAVGGEETTREADEPADGEANVTINEQESGGAQVVVESATLPEGGFIAIHDSSVAEAPLSSVLGNSVYLEPGTHEDVTITLARPIEESQTLVAMPHFDTNENQVYDFVLSTGEVDGPYTVNNEVLIDQANVTVAQETTTTEAEAEETTTTEEEVVGETTTEEDVVEEETTTEEDVVEETTTEEEVIEETTTEEEVVEETTTEEEVVEETTTEEDVVEETTAAAEEPPAEMNQLVFKVEQMNIDRWSFVVGDEETPDRTETVSNVTITDRRVEINLSEVLQQSAQAQQQAGTMTTLSPEEAEEMIEENLSQDIETVRFVISDVTVENVTFVVTAPEDVELPEPPMTTTEEEVVGETTTEEEVIEETTTEEEVVEETTTEEEVIEETTTEEEVVEETTTEEEVVEETTTEEEVVEETTTEEDVVEETTTEEEVVEETTTTTEEEVEETTTEEEVEETTTEEDAEADLGSYEVSNLDAPDSATIGETVTVSATVSNPNDQQATQNVALRLEGTVIANQSVTLDAGEQTTVEFEIDTEDVPAGQYIHGVYTRNFGELGVIVMEESSQETTAAAETETSGNVTTTAAA